MRASTLFIAPLLAGIQLVAAGNCDAYSACVTLYSDAGGNNQLLAYRPTCKGNCFVYDIQAAKLATAFNGDGTDCIFYYDNNCQNPIPGHTHDGSNGAGVKHNFGGARAQVPRACQRCKTLRRGCSEFRPCRRCIDAGLSDQCIAQSVTGPMPWYPTGPFSAGMANPLQKMMELAPVAVIDHCAERFFIRLYPTIPILTQDYVSHLKVAANSTSEWAFEAYCVLVAMCAQVLLQAEDPDDLFLQGIIPNKNAMYGQMMLDLAVTSHQMIPRNVKPTLNQCLLTFFLYACHSRLSRHSQAFIFLREATTLFHLFRFDDLESNFKPLATQLFWVLVVSERSHAIRYRRPLTLQVTNETPKLSTTDSSLAGFYSLVDLFRPVDTSFVASLNHEILATPPSLSSLEYVETTINTAVKASIPLEDTQKANLRITQLWLRVIIWKLRLHLGYLSEASNRRSLTYRYPIEVAKDLMLSTRDLPIDSIRIHGVGLTEKLYDIASTVVDVLARVPLAAESPGGLAMGTSPEDDLSYIRHLISRLPGGVDNYDPLLEKHLQQALPSRESSLGASELS
ncbi:hypothetical protein BGZ63DRAFT_424945 [Mariannaea sp. PMI_226]|nr:hypothetical protein BGZ63DRAFT_424945 [Mariannaea sp. PMI_226]